MAVWSELTLSAARLSVCLTQVRVQHRNYDLRMYNYGSPRVGNDKFVEHFNAKVPNSWRIKNDYDLVSVSLTID
jgi:predicted lipase